MKLLLITFICLLISCANQGLLVERVEDIPAQFGLAGAVLGKSNGVILLAGGANFSQGFPWDGGKKQFHSKAYIFNGQWQESESPFKEPIAQGMSIETNFGLFHAGGNNGNNLLSSCFFIHWQSGKLKLDTSLPDLPIPLETASICTDGNNVFVSGGKSSNGLSARVFQLNLKKPLKWIELENLPQARNLANSFIYQDTLYVIGGYDSINSVSLIDVLVYKSDKWHKIGEVTLDKKKHAITGSAISFINKNEVLFVGGTTGKNRIIRDHLKSTIVQLDPSTKESKSLREKRLKLTVEHPGHRDDMLIYNCIKNSWRLAGKLTEPSSLKTRLLPWKGSFLYIGGEIKPAVRTAHVYLIKPKNKL